MQDHRRNVRLGFTSGVFYIARLHGTMCVVDVCPDQI